MAVRLNAADADFEARFATLLAGKRENAPDVEDTVRSIIADVRSRGDQAVLDLTRRLDRHELTAGQLRISPDEIEAAVHACEPNVLDALSLARDRIEAHHLRQRPSDETYVDGLGVELGSRWTAIEAVGIYVPGGTASYPSSVLMNAVPAKVAGVERLVMVVPSPDGRLNPLVLAAAQLAGVDEIYRIGGAQAIAALAYGTATVAPVDKIVGPGNAYVAAAKRQVFGAVGIDMLAGPSEVLVVADRDNDPDWIAADLLAQAEHDTAAQAILITDNRDFAEAVDGAVERQLGRLPRAETGSGELARFRRDHHRWKSGSERPLDRPHRTRASGARGSRTEAIAAAHPQCRSHFPRPPYAGSDRRLRCGVQPCAADFPLGAFLFRAFGARFHEAHIGAATLRGQPASARPGGDHTGKGGRVRSACPVGRDQAQPLAQRRCLERHGWSTPPRRRHTRRQLDWPCAA
jgi:histidinol dehydrogenase